jgi:hypothetical protein
MPSLTSLIPQVKKQNSKNFPASVQKVRINSFVQTNFNKMQSAQIPAFCLPSARLRCTNEARKCSTPCSSPLTLLEGPNSVQWRNWSLLTGSRLTSSLKISYLPFLMLSKSTLRSQLFHSASVSPVREFLFHSRAQFYTPPQSLF